LQRLRARREGLHRRRADVRPQRPRAPARVRLPAGPGGEAVKRASLATLALALAALCAGGASAQDVLIRHAKVHTAGTRGTLADVDVLVQGGVIRAVGKQLGNPAGVPVFDARGASLTPGLWGGFSGIGLEEVQAEKSTVDDSIDLPGRDMHQMRPEFDVTLAYNPDSMLLPVARLGGITFTALTADN